MANRRIDSGKPIGRQEDFLSNRTPSSSLRIVRFAGWTALALLATILAANFLLSAVFGLGHPVLVTPDSACGYILKPNQNVYRFFCHTRTDRYGMRSAPFSPIPAPGTLRIMFVGDSVTYGTSHVDQSRIFTQDIRRGLPAIVHRPVEVLDASASAWAPDNELSWVRSRGVFHSQLVLLVLNSGDLTQPRATISEVGEATTLNHPDSALGELWTRWLRRKLFHTAAGVDAGDSTSANAEATIRSNLADLAAFQSLVTTQGARFAIVYIPFRKEIPQPAAQSQAILHSWTAAHDVPLFDLTSAEAAEPTRAISLDGDHFNTHGNLVVATAIESQWTKVLGTVQP